MSEPNSTPQVKFSSRFIKHWELFLDYQQRRDQTVRFISKGGADRNIIDYVKDSVDRMNEYKLKPGHKEDWQQNVFDPKTRDKVIAILGRLAATRMKPEILVKSSSIWKAADTEERSRIYSDLLEAANIKNRDEERLIWEMYTGLSEGTVIGFESWKRDTRSVEYVTEFDPDTGEKKSQTIKYDAWDDVYGEIVPIDEFYPETIWTSDFDNNVKRCFWVQEITEQQFQDRYGKFKNASKVQVSSFFLRDNSVPWGISSDVDPENIQVLHFYDENTGEMGIWANTIELYWGPMPWNHMRKPFWMGRSEPIHNQFLYGKSMPDKLMGMQDIDNAILNGMLDQLFLGLNSPVFASGVADLEEGYLEPGRLYDIEPGGKVERVSFGQNDPMHFQMLGLIKQSMEESSISAQNQGVPTGGRKTKFEVQALQEGATNLAGMFLTMMEQAIERKYWLRIHNVIQYYSMPSRTKTGKKKFKFLTLEDRKLSNGKTGKKIIQIANDAGEAPNADQLGALAGKIEGKPFNPLESKVEPVVITRDFFLDNEFDLIVKIVPNSSVKDSKFARDNKTLVWFQNTAEDPLIDPVENRKNFAEAMGQPTDLVREPEQQQQGPQLPEELSNLLGGAPTPGGGQASSPDQQLNQV